MNYAAHATSSQNQNPADYFYSAATRRSRGVLWPIFTPARIAALRAKLFIVLRTGDGSHIDDVAVFTN
jgi:hypothetical protein